MKYIITKDFVMATTKFNNQRITGIVQRQTSDCVNALKMIATEKCLHKIKEKENKDDK